MGFEFDLCKPEHSYIFGFFQADGSLSENTRNRGRLEVELSLRDIDILQKIKANLLLNSSLTTRTRNTNFKNDYTSATLSLFDLKFRKSLIALGMPVGKKHLIIRPPEVEFCELDYARGLLDGDGSLGLDGKRKPFISLNTSSDYIRNWYVDLILRLTGKIKNPKRNKRDNTYNIVMFNEAAQNLTKKLYYENCLALNRKLYLAQEILKWKRPSQMRISPNNKFWTQDQDEYILTHALESSTKTLKRSVSSVQMRLWRLKNAMIN